MRLLYKALASVGMIALSAAATVGIRHFRTHKNKNEESPDLVPDNAESKEDNAESKDQELNHEASSDQTTENAEDSGDNKDNENVK